MSLCNLVPLFILFVVVGVMAFIGFVVYGIVQGVSSATRERMEKRHILITKDGVTVNVKELNDEDYVDRSQSVLVSIWNHSSFPAYKNRWWSRRSSDKEDKKSGEKRRLFST
ncbi:hypothetical protein VTN00DRAFT_1557 [Thermoascus crustaceus]|uniref:uncharacterized protein n=1 Tax=Thermoascus crustaceus TaxID=5088 RepID=UPI003742D255